MKKALLCSFLLSAIALQGQTANGTLTGIVLDPANAVVPNAKVRARNIGTGFTTESVTSREGVYALSLRPAMYAVTVEASGFKTLERTGIEVNVNQTIRVDMTLQVGALTERVTVEAVAPLVQADTSELGMVFRQQTVLDLPLSTPGNRRYVDAFTLLVPGQAAAADTGWNGLGESVASNGAQLQTRDVQYDGATSGVMTSAGRIWSNAPPPDAVQEFKMITGTPSAEFGGFPGGTISLALRSGSNALHGSAYEYLRNDKFHARDFFAKTKPKDRQSEAGFTIGGPVVIPKLYDGRNRTFFFGYYNLMRWRTESGTSVLTVPPPDMLAGDFTRLLDPQGNMKLIFDPLTSRLNARGEIERDPFPGNKIPANRLSKVSRNIAALIPQPNIPGAGVTRNYLGKSFTYSNDDRWMSKVDHSMSSRQRISGSFTWAKFVRDGWGPFPEEQRFISGIFTRNETAHLVRLSHDFTISPSVVNRFTFGFNRDHPITGTASLGGDWGNKLGLKGTAAPGSSFPHITFGSDIDDGQRLSGESDEWWAENSFVYSDIVNVIRGKHSMRIGGDFRKYQMNYSNSARTHGTFGFSSGMTNNPASPNRLNTGSGVASFVLGAVGSGTVLFPTVTVGDRVTYGALFFQDDYKIARKLTLNLGLRWDVALPIKEVFNRMSFFDPTLPNPGAGNLPGALRFVGNEQGMVDSLPVKTDWNNFQPRVGFAFEVLPNTVLRGGYSVMVGMSGVAVEGGIGTIFQQGYNAQPTYSTTDPTGVNPAFYWDDGFPQTFVKPPTLITTFLNTPMQSLNNWVRQDDGVQPYIQQWQFGIQRQFGANLAIEGTYVGTKGTRLSSLKLQPQQLHPKYMALGTLLGADINSQVAKDAGYKPPYPGFVGTVAQSLRQFPQYLGITDQFENLGFSNYHSFQLLVQKRSSYGLNATLAYTLSKAISDAPLNRNIGKPGIMDAYNPQLDKTLNANDAPHNIAIGYSYELPIGAGKPLNMENSALNYIAGGWQITGTWRYYSGRPLGVSGAETTGIFSGNRPTYAFPFQPIRTSVSPGDFDPATDVYLNRGAFTTGERYKFGDVPARLPSTRGFAYYSENIGVLKNFKIKERFGIELRGEAYNFLNRTRFGAPNTSLTSVTFGRVTSSDLGRQMQLCMRLSF